MRPHLSFRSATSAKAVIATVLAGAFLAACAGVDTAGPGGGAGPGQQAQGGTSGTTFPMASPNLKGDVALEPFNSCDALLGWIKEQALPHVTANGLEGYGGDGYGVSPQMAVSSEGRASGPVPSMPGASTTTMESAAPTTSPPSAGSKGGADNSATASPAAPGGTAGSATHSGTNNQEASVDEPDTVKNDGDRLFVVDQNRILAYADLGSTPRQAGSLSLDTNYTSNHQMLLAGNRLIVLSVSHGYGQPLPMKSADPSGGPRSVSSPSGPMTLIQVVDVSDLSNMRVIDRVGVDGKQVSARFANGKMRIVTSSHPASFNFMSPNGRGAEAAAKDANRKVIENSKIEDWMPRMYLYGGGTGYINSSQHKPLLGCTGVSKPKEFGGLGVLSVLSIDPNGTVDPANNVAVMGDGDTVYASPTSLYVTTNEVSWGLPQGSDGSTPTTLPGNQPSSRPCIVEPNGRPGPRCGQFGSANVHTAVHKFDLTGTGPAIYRASGKFDGALLNQYSMSEQGGILRAATTSSANGTGASMGSESQVVAMREDAGELKVVGKVGGLGKNENIRSVRFIGNIGYVVTFRQTDPLYTIDLTDPANLRVAGELKILGYSAYLHPVGDGLLLGVGQDATTTGRTTGTQVQLFDVRDPANPKAIQKLVIPGANSAAETDFHSFLWWAADNLAVIPVTAYSNGGPPMPVPELCAPDVQAPGIPCRGSSGGALPYQPSQPFLGVVGFNVKAEGIREVGRVQHFGSQGSNGCGPATDCYTPPPPSTIVCVTTPCTTPSQSPPVSKPIPAYPVQVTRTVVAGDNLLTLSSAGLKASNRYTFNDTTWVPAR